MTREHIFGQWVRRLAGISQVAPARHTLHRPGEPARVVDFDARPLEQTARVVCEACNNGWMSKLEEDVAPILGPMLQGRSSFLTAADLELLSTWAFKTSYVVDAAALGSTPQFPPAHRHWFYKNVRPPPSSLVWMTTWPGTTTSWTQHWGITLETTDGALVSQGRVYGAALAIGPLVFRVLGSTSPAVGSDQIEDSGPGVARIWPEPQAFQWAALFHLAEHELEQFAFEIPRAIEHFLNPGETDFWDAGPGSPTRDPAA